MPTKFLNNSGILPFEGANTFFGTELGRSSDKSDFGIIGIPFDFGSTFRTGQRFAPEKIRQMSRIISGVDYFIKEDVFREFTVLDYGDVNVTPGYIDKSLKSIEDHFLKLSNETNIVSVGGDHLVTLPILRSIFKKFGKIELIDIDAHTDTWDNIYGLEYSHANWLRHAMSENLLSKITQIAIRGSLYTKDDNEFQEKFGVEVYDMQKIKKMDFDLFINQINKETDSDAVYITLDIDAVDPAFAPGTGIPEPGGLSSWEIMSLFRNIEFKAVGMDIVEINPLYDQSDITSILGANIIFQYISSQAKLCRS